MSPYTDQDLQPGEPDEPLSDAALKKALAQAPDRSKLPDWRIRQAILDHAHDAVSAAGELLAASRTPAPWWKLAWWRDKVGVSGAMPWNAVLASLLVAVLVTLIWQREPVPGAQLDERPAAAPPAAKEERPSPEAEARRAPEAPAGAAPGSRPALERAPAPVVVSPAPPAAAQAPPPPTPRAQASATPEPRPAPIESASKAPAREVGGRLAESASAPAAPAAPAAAVTPAPAATPSAVAPAPSRPADADARQKFAPAPAAAPSAGLAQDANRSTLPPALRAAPAPAPGVRTDATPPPDFASLSRWSELRVANVSGDVRIVPRAEAGELSLLLSSAAIMAVGAPPLRALPEWRVSLERKGAVLAVLEVARTQVRWTEGAAPPATGTPPPESLEALRAALQQAIKSRAAVRAPGPPAANKAPEPEPPQQRPIEPAPPPSPVAVPPPAQE